MSGELYRALTIAGSDPTGGAGIQSDIRTMSAMGVIGTSAITAITAQNLEEITGILPVEPPMVAAQIDAAIRGIGSDAVKTGMLVNRNIVRAVADTLEQFNSFLVIDPVIRSSSGTALLDEGGVSALTELLIPRASLLTPNVREAEVLSGMPVRNKAEALSAGNAIRAMGAGAVLITGLCEEQGWITDMLIGDTVEEFRSPRHMGKDPHGTGCMLSAAITAHLARGTELIEAVRRSESLMRRAILHSLDMGRGLLLDPLIHLRNEAERFSTLKEVRRCVDVLVRENIIELIPEVSSNFVTVLPYAVSLDEAAGIEGRIVRLKDRVHAHEPWFGVSDHVARFLLEIRRSDPDMNSSMNIKLSPEIEKRCSDLGLSVSHAPREMEPEDSRGREGSTMDWAATYVMKGRDTAPDIIIDRGAFGKEPMIRILARSSRSLLKKVLDIHSGLQRKEIGEE